MCGEGNSASFGPKFGYKVYLEIKWGEVLCAGVPAVWRWGVEGTWLPFGQGQAHRPPWSHSCLLSFLKEGKSPVCPRGFFGNKAEI